MFIVNTKLSIFINSVKMMKLIEAVISNSR